MTADEGSEQSATRRVRRPTATADFGSGRREAHDATAFYERFVAPELSNDTTVAPPGEVDVIHHADARAMTQVPSNSVALVVTSPPYFAGKQYEAALGVGGVPADYFEYLGMLGDVFAECARVLEPGGRIAVNVANLGRRPFRSLAGDVTRILSELGLLLRGEVVWWKGRAAGGSCAWGSFQSPANPVLRDVTERIVIAGKGRFDRALTPRQRVERGLPSTVTIARDEFMEATTDLWELPPESATRVGHPAPFPVALPARMIELFTYEGDVVLDPFMGSGSTAVAAVRAGRRYVGFDTDPDYIAAASERITAERSRREADVDGPPRVRVEAGSDTDAAPDGADDPVADAWREGRQARDVARVLLESCGFTDIRTDVKPRGLGITLDFVATDAAGGEWSFVVAGGFTVAPSGLRRTDDLWKVLATAAVLRSGAAPAASPGNGLVVLTTELPTKGSPGRKALAALWGPEQPVFDVIELSAAADRARLAAYGSGSVAVD